MQTLDDLIKVYIKGSTHKVSYDHDYRSPFWHKTTGPPQERQKGLDETKKT